MPLVTTTEMFKKAYDGGYAIGAFNVNNMEIVQGITEAAGELKAPVIVGTAEVLTTAMSLERVAEYLIPMAQRLYIFLLCLYLCS